MNQSTTTTQTELNPFFSRRRQVFSFTLTTGGGVPLSQGQHYIIYYTTCCRIRGILNAPEDSFSLSAKIFYGGVQSGSPSLDSQVLTAVAKGSTYTQNLNATDPDGQPMLYSFLTGAVPPHYGPSSQIPGIQLDSTGQVTIPAANTATLGDNPFNPGGDYIFKVRVTDSVGAFSERDVLLDAVTSSNLQPVLAGIGNQTVKVGDTLMFGVSATDPNAGQTVTLRSSTLPAGAVFNRTPGNPANGTFTFTPTAAQIGTFTINFEAVDSDPVQLVDSEQVIITVVGNNKPPVLAHVGSRQAAVGVPLQFFLTATDPNPDDTLSYNGSFLPPGATVDTTTGLFRWTPAAGQANTVFNNIVLSVTDNGAPMLSDSEAIAISVGSANRSPALGPLPDFIFSSPNVPLQMAASGSDPDSGDVVTMGVTGLPAGATFTQTAGNPASALFSWTPAANQTGIFAVTCTATDNGSPNLQDRFTTNYVIAADGGTPASVCVAPNAGKVTGGTFVTVRGTGFVAGTSVTLNGIGVISLTVVNSSTLTFFTPVSGVTGPVDLTVTTPAGQDVLEGAFVYHQGPDRPVERLIGIVGPDANGNVTIRGAIGAVAADGAVEFTFPGAAPIVQNVTAGPDGSFTHSVPAALAQTSFLVRVTDATGQSPITVVNAAAPAIAGGLVTSAPNGPGQVRITGAPGAVPARGELIVLLPDGTALLAVAAADGSFVVTVPTAAVRSGVLLNAANCVGSVVARMMFQAQNAAPVADAGADQTLASQAGGRLVTLDGTGSSDADGETLTYNWSSATSASLGTTATLDQTLGTGTHVFTLTVTDPSGDSSSDTVTITLTDGVAPVVTAPANVVAEAIGPDGATVGYTGASATDDIDGPLPVTCSPPSGADFALGATTVTCSAADAAGNEGTASFTVTVQDTTKPIVSVPANLTAEATDANGALVDYGAVSATDAVTSPLSVTCNQASNTTFPLGATTVNCSATDAAGNTGTASFTVTVQDTTKPALTVPADAIAEATSAAGAVVDYGAASATDAVSTPTVICSQASNTTFALGATTVNCSATDAAGNTSTGSFTVTVQDTTKPDLTVPANALAEATGAAGAVVDYGAPSATDAVSTPTVTCSPATNTTFALGATTINCSATDAAGNTSTGSFTVTVQDTTKPALTVPADAIAEATGAAGALVDYGTASATDAVSTPAVSCSPASNTTFALGATTVNCSATDAAGNTSTGSFTVTVQDTTKPAITVPSDIIVSAANADGAVVPYDAASATDAVTAALTVSCSQASNTTFPVGTTTVTCSATDGAGNTGSASFTITVRDTTAPVVTASGDKTAEATSAAGAPVSYGAASAFDAVDGSVAATCDKASGSLFALGSTTVACTATDAAGNTGSASFVVTVEDTTKPAVTVSSAVIAEATSAAGAVVTYDAASATDLVTSPLTVSCSKASNSTFALGSTTVTCSATDAAGNTGHASFEVTVQDTTAPALTLPASFTVGATSPAGATATYAASATDVVSGNVGITCSPASGLTFGVGTTTVTCTSGADGAGLTATGTFTVTVLTAAGQAANTLEDLLSGTYGDQAALATKLESVLAALADGNVNAACGSLGAFENQINAKIGKTLTAAQAAALIAAGRQMQAAAGCR